MSRHDRRHSSRDAHASPAASHPPADRTHHAPAADHPPAADHTHHAPAATGTAHVGTAPGWAWVAFIIVMLFLVIGKACGGDDEVMTDQELNLREKEEQQKVTPRMISYETPISLSIDYEYSIEAGQPIKITYADGQSVVFFPDKGCQKFPEPKWSGPNKFTDPDDTEKKVAFRVYRLLPGEIKCK